MLSIEAKLLYGMMIDRMELSQKNGWIDGQGRVYIFFTVDDVKDRLHCANDKAVTYFDRLNFLRLPCACRPLKSL